MSVIGYIKNIYILLYLTIMYGLHNTAVDVKIRIPTPRELPEGCGEKLDFRKKIKSL